MYTWVCVRIRAHSSGSSVVCFTKETQAALLASKLIFFWSQLKLFLTSFPSIIFSLQNHFIFLLPALMQSYRLDTLLGNGSHQSTHVWSLGSRDFVYTCMHIFIYILIFYFWWTYQGRFCVNVFYSPRVLRCWKMGNGIWIARYALSVWQMQRSSHLLSYRMLNYPDDIKWYGKWQYCEKFCVAELLSNYPKTLCSFLELKPYYLCDDGKI